MTHIRHPQSPRDIAERDRLLQAALRPSPSPYPIAREYPSVLSPQDVRFSWGLYSDTQQLVAHANLWPRVLLDHETGSSMNVGLIGNVATDTTLRGQGHMSHLLEKLAEKATQDGLHALILWSDLSEFYQRRGFSSCGLERRYTFHIPSLRQRLPNAHRKTPFRFLKGNQIPQKSLAKSRFHVRTTLTREAGVWGSLLGIAGLNVFATSTQDDPIGEQTTTFVAIGKGFDLVHVVHEWGAPSPELLLHAMANAGDSLGYDELMLLSPHDLPGSWLQMLGTFALNQEIHPMALARVLKDTPETHAMLAKTFIWGLDSI